MKTHFATTPSMICPSMSRGTAALAWLSLAAGLLPVTLSLVSSTADAATEYTLTGLLAGGGYSNASGINDSGQIVGGSASASGAYAFLYSDGTLTDLGTLAGGTRSYATGINNAGEIVGASNTSSGKWHAFAYSGSTMSDLGTLGGSSSYATGVNGSGQVVGYSATSSGDQHAFEYSGGTMSDLGTLGGSSSYATGINDSGQVVGRAATSAGDTHAFDYSGGTMSDLGTLGGSANYSGANGINASGQIAGRTTTPGGNTHAFLYNAGVMADLGTPSGGSYSFAYGVNASGQVVGYSETSSHVQTAFVYSGGTISDLNSLIPSGSGWTLTQANAINRYGDIVGMGTNPNNRTEAFLLMPTYSDTTSVATGGQAASLLGGASQTNGVAVSFSNVTSAGSLSVAYQAVTSPTSTASQATFGYGPISFTVPGSMLQLWDLHFTGTFTGDATVTFGFDPSLLPAGLNPADLRLYHYSGNQWVLLGDQVVNTTTDTISALTPGFSPFALGEVVPGTAPLALLAVGSLALIGRRRKAVA